MERKTLLWIGVMVGSTVGGFIPDLWNAGLFSFSSIILSAVGGIVGIWLALKISG